MRRTLSLILAVAMMMPVLATVAEAAVGTWLSPQPGQLVPAGKVEVAIGFNTQSDAKVSSLELYVDGRFYARKLLVNPISRGVCSFWWDASGATKGSHDLLVKIFSGNTLVSKVSGTGTVGGSSAGLYDTRAPKVMFANIRSGDVLKGIERVDLSASDDSGESPLVSLLVDNSLKMLRNTKPYTYDLDTTTYADGDHKLETYAYDSAGNRSDPAVVTVAFKNNQPKPVIAAMTVDTKPIKVVEEDGTVVTVPASIAALATPVLRNSAARASDPASGKLSAPAASAPAATSEITVPKVVVTPTPKLSAPSASSPAGVRVAALPPSLRSEKSGSAPAYAPQASEPAAAYEPIATSTTARAASAVVPTTRSTAAKPYQAPAACSAPDEDRAPAVSAAPKPVRVAMAPDIRSLKTHPRLNAGYATPPQIEKSTKARIEKKIVPASGKVKIRELIEQLGGVVLWDPITHTVTTLVDGIKIEMRIGSSTAVVNGRDMQIGIAPTIVNGRTVIDASVYHQACAFAGQSSRSASIQ